MLDNDSTISVDLVYQNRGNQYETIAFNRFTYSGTSAKDMTFEDDTTLPMNAFVKYSPLILSGEHKHIKLANRFSFKQAFPPLDTITVAIEVGFIGSDGAMYLDKLKTAVLFLDSTLNIGSTSSYNSNKVLKQRNKMPNFLTGKGPHFIFERN